MTMYDLIEKKKRGIELSKEEIEFIVYGYTDGSIPDYQMSSFLMAVWFNGMNKEETYHLTMSMMNSGEVLDLSKINGIKVDKHSTGGVGDKTTLILGPIVAALGIPVAKLSGRGLGHTGGTIDKLESIPGFNTSVETEDFIGQVNDINIAVAGQTSNLAPADKKIYALRDVTATVDNISLIASSIMSKKLASGADAIVLDVKCGSGAFMKNEDDALALAKEMVDIGKSAGKDIVALVTDMDEPLGRYVGNSLEVYEAVLCLMGQGDKKLMDISKALAAHMVVNAKENIDIKEAYIQVEEAIESGAALKKMVEFVARQGGDVGYILNPELLPKGDVVIEYKAKTDGYVKAIQAETVGKACLVLGGGRRTKEDVINSSVGLFLNKKKGEKVKAGEAVVTIYAESEAKAKEALALLDDAYEFIAEEIVIDGDIIKYVV
ncbi:MAG: pyrimidine-nucleoside phosphorylase [Lachnospiraceae bacterium]|nr:pyrimidine-nucleoside phosphorylase [Lachnospiraceae bacterium]